MDVSSMSSLYVTACLVELAFDVSYRERITHELPVLSTEQGPHSQVIKSQRDEIQLHNSRGAIEFCDPPMLVEWNLSGFPQGRDHSAFELCCERILWDQLDVSKAVFHQERVESRQIGLRAEKHNSYSYTISYSHSSRACQALDSWKPSHANGCDQDAIQFSHGGTDQVSTTTVGHMRNAFDERGSTDRAVRLCAKPMPVIGGRQSERFRSLICATRS
jgi:hypothetical protein